MKGRLPVAVAIAAATLAVGVPSGTADVPPEDPVFGVPCDTVGRAGDPLGRGFNCRTVAVQSYPRVYIVYVPHNPEFKPTKKWPLVVGQHGSGGSGGNFIQSSGWIARAESDGATLAFGTALEASVIAEGGNVETRWNAYGQEDQIDLTIKPEAYPEDADWPADDVGFIDAILDDVESNAILDNPQETIKVDRKRVFATGFSNGAVFTARVGIELSDRVAAITGFGGSLLAPVEALDPAPYFLGWGNDDRHLAPAAERPVPLDPDAWGAYPDWLGLIEATARSWGATGEPDRTLIGPPMTLLEWDLDGAPLRIALLDGVGHEYPDGADLISWEFFEENAK